MWHLWQQRLLVELRVKLTNYLGKYLRDFDNNNVATQRTDAADKFRLQFRFQFVVQAAALAALLACATNCASVSVCCMCVCASQPKQCDLKVGRLPGSTAIN